MFEKLLASLPYNPSLVTQMGFYAKRMHREESVRRTGLVFIVLSFFIQFFAVVVPPQPTVAASTNDLINNGISSAADAAQHCRANSPGEDYGTILANYGISCDAVAKATTVSIKSTDNNKQLYSMGRLPYGKTGEQIVTISGKKYYVRYLWSWDSGAYSTYKALKVTASTGTTYWILYNCGNLTSVGVPAALPQAPAPKPSFTMNKLVHTPGSGAYYEDVTIKPGEKVEFSIDIYNNGNVDLARVEVRDTLPAGLTAVPGSLAVNGKPVVALLAGFNMGGLRTAEMKQVTFSATAGTTVDACAAKRLVNTVAVTADSLPTKQDTATVQVCKPTQTPTPTPTVPTPTPCQYNSSLPASSTDCKPCDKSTSSADSLACLSVHKAATNQTQNIADANNTTAHAGDTIVYTLYAQNNGKATIKDFTFQENISDVLDYADIVDPHGGSLDANKVLTWPASDIKAGETVNHQVTVKVKDPIPQTPVSSSDGGHFDLVMTNVFGNTINIKVPGGTVKTVEAVTTALPNTGPGSSLIAAAAIVIVAGYFFARARLIATETMIAVHQNVNHGGI